MVTSELCIKELSFKNSRRELVLQGQEQIRFTFSSITDIIWKAQASDRGLMKDLTRICLCDV